MNEYFKTKKKTITNPYNNIPFSEDNLQKIYTKLNCVENMLISHKASDSGFIFAKIPNELTEKAENLLNFVGLYQNQ